MGGGVEAVRVVAPASASTPAEEVCAVQAYVPGDKVSIDAPSMDVLVTLHRVTTWETHNIFSRTSQAVTVPGR